MEQHSASLSSGAQKLRELIYSDLPNEELATKAAPYAHHRHELLSSIEAERTATQEEIACLDSAVAWMESAPFRLQPNDCSRAHKLIESLQSGGTANTKQESRMLAASMFKSASVFVVRHDWAAAFGDSLADAAGDIKLPYEACLFEFVINGRCVILAAHQADQSGGQPQAMPFLEIGPGKWYGGSVDDCKAGGAFHLAWQQVVAVCVALDAEIATHSVTRAPAALNKKRERNDKPPLMDFHVVDLARRHRVIGLAAGSHRSPRLHFRRGHWRHYEKQKSWIKWTLVGNPDLGFVDKQYRM